MTRRIAVIGAGSCGLTAIKTCKEEGMEPTCFERSDSIGGLWQYREDVQSEACVPLSTVTNTSKEMTAFSDFPPPSHFPNYLHHFDLIDYLHMYADRFDLLRHVAFHEEVVDVEPAEDYLNTGSWQVTVVNRKTGVRSRHTFDGVIVCTGHYVFPNIPTFNGMDTFQGAVVHTRNYRTPEPFRNKRVLIIGLGNSGGDVAVDMTSVAQKVYISSRRGSWIMARTGFLDLPLDLVSHRRLVNYIIGLLPFRATCSLVEKQANRRLDHSRYGLKPNHRILNQQPTVNEHLINRILTGEIVVKRDIVTFSTSGVVFEGEDFTTEIDAVVLATGYRIEFPFLADDILKVVDNHVTLYKYVFPPDLDHPTLATIGLIHPQGSVFPVAEMQSRWVALVMNKKISLPSREAMMKDINERKLHVASRYIRSPRHTIQGEWIPYMDEIASLIGSKPNLTVLALTDPKLFWTCLCGPCLPYQYRLQGPHSWVGARATLLSWKKRSGLLPRKAGRERRMLVNAFIFTAFVVLVWKMSQVI